MLTYADIVQPLEATMNPLYTEDDLQFITRMWAGEIIWTLPGMRNTRKLKASYSISEALSF
jgi:hypothetical protein